MNERLLQCRVTELEAELKAYKHLYEKLEKDYLNLTKLVVCLSIGVLLIYPIIYNLVPSFQMASEKILGIGLE